MVKLQTTYGEDLSSNPTGEQCCGLDMREPYQLPIVHENTQEVVALT